MPCKPPHRAFRVIIPECALDEIVHAATPQDAAEDVAYEYELGEEALLGLDVTVVETGGTPARFRLRAFHVFDVQDVDDNESVAATTAPPLTDEA
jgi:hypothetical protein